MMNYLPHTALSPRVMSFAPAGLSQWPGVPVMSPPLMGAPTPTNFLGSGAPYTPSPVNVPILPPPMIMRPYTPMTTYPITPLPSPFTLPPGSPTTPWSMPPHAPQGGPALFAPGHPSASLPWTVPPGFTVTYQPVLKPVNAASTWPPAMMGPPMGPSPFAPLQADQVQLSRPTEDMSSSTFQPTGNSDRFPLADIGGEPRPWNKPDKSLLSEAPASGEPKTTGPKDSTDKWMKFPLPEKPPLPVTAEDRADHLGKILGEWAAKQFEKRPDLLEKVPEAIYKIDPKEIDQKDLSELGGAVGAQVIQQQLEETPRFFSWFARKVAMPVVKRILPGKNFDKLLVDGVANPSTALTNAALSNLV